MVQTLRLGDVNVSFDDDDASPRPRNYVTNFSGRQIDLCPMAAFDQKSFTYFLIGSSSFAQIKYKTFMVILECSARDRKSPHQKKYLSTALKMMILVLRPTW